MGKKGDRQRERKRAERGSPPLLPKPNTPYHILYFPLCVLCSNSASSPLFFSFLRHAPTYPPISPAPQFFFLFFLTTFCYSFPPGEKTDMPPLPVPASANPFTHFLWKCIKTRPVSASFLGGGDRVGIDRIGFRIRGRGGGRGWAEREGRKKVRKQIGRLEKNIYIY